MALTLELELFLSIRTFFILPFCAFEKRRFWSFRPIMWKISEINESSNFL
jgi:hypothetical protein